MAVNAKKVYITGADVIAASVPGHLGGSYLNAVLVHLSAGGGASNLTVKLNSIQGSAYDTIFETKAMNGITDYAYIPSNPVALEPGDSIDIDYANGGKATYGVTVILLDA